MKYIKYLFLILISNINSAKKEIKEVKIEENNKEKLIKKEINDSLKKYVNENDITTENFREKLTSNIRKIVLKKIYEKYNEDKSLINKSSNNFYRIMINKK